MSIFMKALSHGENGQRLHKYSLTIEQIEEMDAARARGEISEIELSFPSLEEQIRQAGRYGSMAREYLMRNNFPKFMRLLTEFVLWEELIALAERVEAFKDEMWEAYKPPKTTDFLERVSDRRMYQSQIEERIFEEIIKPFAEGD